MNSSPSIRGAILDLGSNSFKLMLAEQKKTALLIHSEHADITRLGEGVAIDSMLKPQAIKRSLIKLTEYKKIIRDFAPSEIIATGTSALRSSKNRKEFLAPAQEILGVPIRIISGNLEAELVYRGVSSTPRWRHSEIVNLDLGGGSLEIVHGKSGRILWGKSYELGCVRIKDLFFKRYPSGLSTLKRAQEHVSSKLKSLPLRFRGCHASLTASGGSAITLSSLILQGNLSHAEGLKITRNDLQEQLLSLSKLSLSSLRKLPGMLPHREDITLAGALVLYTTMDLMGYNALHISTRGLRYGIWNKWISPHPFDKVVRL